MILLSAHEVEKSFANRVLFKDLSLGIEERERIGFVGPNGAGKSTLLKILAGEVDSDGGTISKKKGLRLAFLEQNPSFSPQDTILQAILKKTLDPDDATAKAYELMARLELADYGGDFLVSQLSGGWKKRVALARELVSDPDLLFLDEPTNHLDISSILWLEEYLRQARFSLLMVTHDRLFLQRVANRILDLDPRNPNYLLSVNGEYSQYLETKEIELAALQRQEKVEKNRLRRETEWLRRGSIARQTKQSARIEAAHELKDTVQDLKNKNQNRKVDLSFGEAERSPKKLIEATQISKSFGSRVLFENLDILITPKTRLGLLGNNGCGKSTLIKVLLGIEAADSGTIKRADGIEHAYFEQSRETLNQELSVLKNICPDGDHVSFQGNFVHVRSYLDRFFFTGQKVEIPVKKLSGGEQARLRLAQLMLKQSQILVLDEPTNDLDTAMLESLERSLSEYHGAVIIVTHDRYFLDAVANQILAFPDLHKFSGYYQWEEWFQEHGGQTKGPTKKTEGGSGAKRSRLSFKDKFELENMEATILKLEDDLGKLQKESESPVALSNHVRLSEIHTLIDKLQSEIEKKYQRWSELEAQRGECDPKA